MTRRERKGIAFGFALMLIWLLILTGLTSWLVYDKMCTKHIIRPAQLEVIPLQDLMF